MDLIFACHFLEHLTYEEGLRFLRECRRVIRPDGAMRILVPDAKLLCGMYEDNRPSDLSEFDEINDGCANAPTSAGKLWAMLFQGHQAAYDQETLSRALEDAGFQPLLAAFRQVGHHPSLDWSAVGARQILKEAMDILPCHTLFMDAIPRRA